ncbi:synaptogyrin isoform X1 [Nomia melanderi]|uniref:synaptogyrin isoform X1 n=1 Tax=Nomia melanderi TaxID=2448451 RepID=UPI003FCC7D44
MRKVCRVPGSVPWAPSSAWPRRGSRYWPEEVGLSEFPRGSVEKGSSGPDSAFFFFFLGSHPSERGSAARCDTARLPFMGYFLAIFTTVKAPGAAILYTDTCSVGSVEYGLLHAARYLVPRLSALVRGSTPKEFSRTKMDGGAYGGGKAGAPFDPIAFVQRPQVILRTICLLFAIIVFGCISNKGYMTKADGKEVCLYAEDPNACNYGIGIGVLAFLASIGFLIGEYLFEQMSSVKTRKHFVLLDLGSSGFWAFLYFVGFCYLTNSWNKSDVPSDVDGAKSVQSAIAFSFFSIFTWAGCAWFAFQRFKQGTDAAFAPSYEADPVGGTGYTSYPDATDTGYQDPPFGQQQQQQQQQQRMPDFQAPAY